MRELEKQNTCSRSSSGCCDSEQDLNPLQHNPTMDISIRKSMEELTKEAQRTGSDPFVWAVQMYSNLNSSGESFPSSQLAEFLVSYICWDNNVPILWKFLDMALIHNIVPPLFLLSLLSVRLVNFAFLSFQFHP